jgi:2-polyprenyl-3-methyl-5-hydroxy-6-metoxy-1,4-benzoquinol methylase
MAENYLWDINNPEGYNNKSGHYKTRVEYDFIINHLPKDRKRILDLGGGSGRFAVPLMVKGFPVTVVDLNEQAIQLCKERLIEDSYCMDFRLFEGKGFDVVLAIELFLVTTPGEVFKIASNSLNDKGLFIFVATNKNSWRYRLHNLRKKKTVNLGEYSLNEYRQMLHAFKFSIIDLKGFNWIPFRVNSNNLFIPVFAFIEKVFSLNHWLKQSPWLLFACRKEGSL